MITGTVVPGGKLEERKIRRLQTPQHKEPCERYEHNKGLDPFEMRYALVKALAVVTPLEATASPRGTRAYLKPP